MPLTKFARRGSPASSNYTVPLTNPTEALRDINITMPIPCGYSAKAFLTEGTNFIPQSRDDTGRIYFYGHDSCSICQNPYDVKDRPVHIRYCHHIFGFECLRTWVESDAKNANKCPMCRQLLFNILPATGARVVVHHRRSDADPLTLWEQDYMQRQVQIEETHRQLRETEERQRSLWDYWQRMEDRAAQNVREMLERNGNTEVDWETDAETETEEDSDSEPDGIQPPAPIAEPERSQRGILVSPTPLYDWSGFSEAIHRPDDRF